MRKQKLEKGTRLTATALATQFNVSRTPITGALIILKERGILGSSHNQGFFVKTPIKNLLETPEEFHQTEEEHLYMMIADDRLKGKLPDKVTEVQLLRQYSTKRGILIRVLHTMSNEGLVYNQQGPGWIFNTVLNSKNNHTQSYNFRKIIEPNGILEDTFKIDQKKIVSIRKQNINLMKEKKVSKADIFEVNSNFHTTLASFSGNSYIRDAVQQQNKLRRFVEYSYNWIDNPQAISEVCLEHLRILDALESGNRKLASSLLWQHLDSASNMQDIFVD
jgi:DNA-binding GntR family transcriptional regulator